MIKLAKPNIPEQAIEKVIEVLKSGNLVQGKYVEEFERKLEDYNGVRNAVVVSSGTAALHLALLALDIKRGDEVVLFGKQNDEYLDLQEICDRLDTINYEILTQISSRIPRVSVNK